MTLQLKKIPKQRLLFFVEPGGATNTVKEAIEFLIENCSKEREWSISPPCYIDDSEGLQTSDMNSLINVVGGSLEIYSANAGDLPIELDRKNFQEVEHLIRATQKLSFDLQIDFEFELDGNFVGSIESGRLDKSLDEGFLREWSGHLLGTKLQYK